METVSNTKKFIAFLDVLGFKDLVANNSHSELTTLFDKAFSPTILMGLAKGQVNYLTQDGKKIVVPDLSKVNVNTLMVSDSIIIWTNGNYSKEFIDLITTVKTLMTHSFWSGFPLRGAIIEGDLSIFKGAVQGGRDISMNSLVGLGLVNAYKIEEQQDWSGCVIDDSCVTRYNEMYLPHTNNPNAASLDHLVSARILTKYKVPFKNGPIKENYAINWVSTVGKPPFVPEDRMRVMFAQYKKTVDDWRIERIIANTVEFVNHIKTTNQDIIQTLS